MDGHSRRRDGSIDFKKRDWVEYEDGFGSLNGEFWLGLRSVHCLTSKGDWELRIDYHLKNGTKSYLHYKQFAVRPAEDQYQLSISGFDSVGLTDPFSHFIHQSLNGMKFSSRDRDNDFSSGSCAFWYGGWWYKGCGVVQINNANAIIYINGEYHAPELLEIKIRPCDCNKNN